MFVLLVGLFGSFQAFADCESVLGYWKVGYPQGSANQTISFKLTNANRFLIWVDAKSWEQADSTYSQVFNELYHAAYENKLVNFGVTSDVCSDLDSYIGSYGGAGGLNVLPVSKMMNLRVVSPR